jgi:hypothetical protein
MSAFVTEEERRAISRARIAYGAACTWWDSIDKVGNTESGLPCCPHCGSVLFEVPSIAAWRIGVDRYAAEKNDPSYAAMVAWGRGKCFPNYATLADKFRATLS